MMGSDSPKVTFSAAVEGALDEAVLRRVAESHGCNLGPVHGLKGSAHLDRQLPGYNRASQYGPWIVLRDLDAHPCAAAFAAQLLPTPNSQMVFRVVVREIESWLLADAEGCSRFLGLAESRIPVNPEAIADPKSALIGLAQISRRSDLRKDIVPRAGSGRSVGPAYTARLSEFAANHWDPVRAAVRSASLRSLIGKIGRLIDL